MGCKECEYRDMVYLFTENPNVQDSLENEDRRKICGRYLVGFN